MNAKSPATEQDVLSSVMENVSQGLSYFDEELKLVVCNRRYLELLGFPLWMGTPGTPLSTFFRHNAERGEYGPGEIEDLVRERLDLARRAEAHCFERERPDGTVLRISGVPVRGGFVTTYDDITELRKSQKELEETNERLDELVWERTEELHTREKELSAKTTALETILESVNYGITLFDNDLALVAANRRAFDMMDVPEDLRIPGTPFERYIRLFVERGDYGAGDVEELVRSRIELAQTFEPHSFVRESSTGRIYETTRRPVEGGFVTTHVDVTEQKRFESLLQANNADLSEKTSALEAVLAALEHGIALFGKDLRLVAANSRAFDLMKVPHEMNRPGVHFSEFLRLQAKTGEFGPGDIEEIVEKLTALAENPEPYHSIRHRSDGSIIEVTRHPIDIGFVATYRDVTEQKQFEALLQANNKKLSEKSAALETILETIDYGISLFDKNLRLVACNPPALDLMAIPAHFNTPGRPLADFLRHQAENGEFGPGDIDEIVAERLEKAWSTEGYSAVWDRPDGRIVEFIRRPIESGFVTTYRDVTGQKQFEALLKAKNKELSEKTAALETILETVDYGITLFDKDLNLVAANPQAFELTDIPESYNYRGCHLSTLLRHQAEQGQFGPGDIDEIIARRTAAAWNETPYSATRERPDGRIIEVVRRMIDNGFVTTYRDVTEQKRIETLLRSSNEELEERVEERTSELNRQLRETERAESEMRAAKSRAEQADRAKSDFLARMSHEIRTPLNGIIGLNHILSSTELTQEQLAIVEKVQSSSDSLLRIVNDILDFAKIEAGRLDLEDIPFSLEEMLHTVQQIAAPRAEEKNLRFEIDTAGAENEHFFGDPHRISQILTNYCSNAIKFTDSGSVRVTAEIEEIGSGRAKVHVAVQDSGIGMTAEESERVFRPFDQADASTTRRFGGTGLGLAICRELADSMGGRVWVESAAGEGSTFHLELPLRRAEADLTETAVEERDWRVACSGMQVLLVEDNMINREIATVLLEGAGMTVLPAVHGKEAVDIMLSETAPKIDAVLMDLQMPEMDGHEATRHILADPRYRDLKVIALTANAVAEEIEKSKSVGMCGHITKPFEPETLFRHLALSRNS
ncbi:PAS-domain containing protein [Nisaea sp.]|uniref:PAS-domain containing protein n=1 Tax=Nisaea sp. TaxID=2024842 RepID=UPI003B517A22